MKPYVIYPHDMGYYHILDYSLLKAARWLASIYRPLPFPEDRHGDADINLEQREGWGYERH